jgi:hypothetical protein
MFGPSGAPVDTTVAATVIIAGALPPAWADSIPAAMSTVSAFCTPSTGDSLEAAANPFRRAGVKGPGNLGRIPPSGQRGLRRVALASGRLRSRGKQRQLRDRGQ